MDIATPITDPTDIWAALNSSGARLAVPLPTPATQFNPKIDGPWVRRWKGVSAFCLDLVAFTWWTYVVLKLFVFDIDREFLRALAPTSGWLLDYKLLVPIVTLLVFSLFLWRWTMFWKASYVIVFPIVIVFWKLPKLFVRARLHRNSMAIVAALNGIVLLGRSLRYQAISKSLAFLAAVTILTSCRSVLLIIAGTTVFVLVIWATVRVIVQTFQARSFMSAQKAFVKLTARFFESPLKLGAKTDRNSALSVEQAREVADAIQIAAMLNRALYLWAYTLQKYRQSNYIVLFNSMSYATLLCGSGLAFFLMNVAVQKLDPTQYIVHGAPSHIAMLLYSLSSLAFADGGGISASGDISYGVRLLAGVFGPTFLLTVMVNAVLVLRGSRDDAELQETVEDLRRRARNHETQFYNAVRVGIEEACERLGALGLGSMMAAVTWLRSAVPPEFMDDHE